MGVAARQTGGIKSLFSPTLISLLNVEVIGLVPLEWGTSFISAGPQLLTAGRFSMGMCNKEEATSLFFLHATGVYIRLAM